MSELNLKYSQNFIKSEALIKRLVLKSGINQDDIVLDIGSGKGKITRLLAKYAKRVVAIEKDPLLIETLKENLSEIGIDHAAKVEIIHADFLNYTLHNKSLPFQKYKIFSNIPFNLTSPIFNHIFTSSNLPKECYLIMQKEAAQRFSGIGSRDGQTQLSAYFNTFLNFEIFHNFYQEDFAPKPAVSVVMLKTTLKKRLDLNIESPKELKLLEKVIVYGFNQWEKNIEKAFEKIFTFGQIKKLSQNLKFNPKWKPSQLSSEHWVGIYLYYKVGVTKEKQLDVERFFTKYIRSQGHKTKSHRTRLSFGLNPSPQREA